MSTAYPADIFPGTPKWAADAALEACERLGLNVPKWLPVLTCIGRYESNYNPAANLCNVDQSLPVGIMQQGRSFYVDAKRVDSKAHEGLGGFADPVRSFVMGAMHIDSRLTVSGGYGGVGTLGGKSGLLAQDDRGPGAVLRAWADDPEHFDIEAARDLYRGY